MSSVEYVYAMNGKLDREIYSLPIYTPIFTHYTHAARSKTRRTRLWSSGEVNNGAFVLLSYVMCVCFLRVCLRSYH